MNRELLVAVDIVLAVFLLSLMAGTPSGFAVIGDTKEKYVDVSGSYVSSLTADLGKEYYGVYSIAVDAIPGGTACSAATEITAYDFNGNQVAKFSTNSVITHKHSQGSKTLSDVRVKTVKGKVKGGWPACGYLDELKVWVDYHKPAMDYSVSFPKTNYGSSPNVLAGQSASMSASSKDGSKLSTITVKIDGTVTKTCSNAASCTYQFTEPVANIGKTRSYSVEAVDSDGGKSTSSGSYKVYGVLYKDSIKSAGDTNLGRDYSVIGIDITTDVGGAQNCKITPKVSLINSGSMGTGNFDLPTVYATTGTTSGSKAFASPISVYRISVYIDNPNTGCYRYVGDSTASIYYSAPAVS